MAASQASGRSPQRRPSKRTRFKRSSDDGPGAARATKTDVRRPPVGPCVPLALLLVALAGLAGAAHQLRPQLARQDANQPSASLSKLGLIRGLHFAWPAPDARPARARPKYRSVAAFLGVPYAAPPTRSLRFMPPGAVKLAAPQQRPAGMPDQLQQCATGQARPFVKFGPECVHLASWLERTSARARPQPDGHARQDAPTSRAGHQERAAHLGDNQSEDCLNLNVFVPFDPVSVRVRAPISPDDPDEPMRRHQRQQQIKSNYPSQEFNYSNKITTKSDNHNSINLDAGEPSQQPRECSLAPISAPARPAPRLPVLVLFHANHEQAAGADAPADIHQEAAHQLGQQTGKPNSLDFVQVAYRTQSIVITFNYRIGLLGFLPYVDAEDQHQHQHQGAGSKAPARHNHAIWDQIGLIHWLRHNVASFNGDPNNITLASADNKAAQWVQLLSMSPLAKGLFKRIILVHEKRDPGRTSGDQAAANVPAALDIFRLLKLGAESRDLRRRLLNELGLIVRRLMGANDSDKGAQNDDQDAQVFEFIKSANLGQLAQIEHELGFASDGAQLLLLATEPNLDDKLLFPHFSALFKMNRLHVGRQDQPSSTSWLARMAGLEGTNQTSLRNELDYCLYMRRLYDANSLAVETGNLSALNELDPIGLLPRPPLAAGTTKQASGAEVAAERAPDGATGHSWAQDPGRLLPPATRWRRLASAAPFNHLRHAHLLSSLLAKLVQSKVHDESRAGEDDDDDDEDLVRKQQQRSILVSGVNSAAVQRARRHSGSQSAAQSDFGPVLVEQHQSGDQFPPLVDLVGSFDLMVGFVGRPLHASGRAPIGPPSDYPNIVDALAVLMGYHQLDEHFLYWLKLADLHYVLAATSNELQLTRYCDLHSAARQQIASRWPTSSFVFAIGEQDIDDSGKSWILDASEATDGPASSLIDSVASFLRSGEPEPTSDWPRYDPMARPIKWFEAAPTDGQAPSGQQQQTRIRDLMSIQLDLVPYLSLGSPTGQQHANSNRPQQVNEPLDLAICLNDIDSALKGLQLATGPLQDQLAVARLHDECQCLANSTRRLRNQLRSSASYDLEPIIRRQFGSSSAAAIRQLALIGRSSMATRNLASQEGAPADPEAELGQSQLVQAAATGNGSLVAATGQGSAPTSAKSATGAGTISGLLARAYKDAVGQALTVVIGTGLLIFLLNLLIVVVVLRSARARRRNRRNVHDCSSSLQPQEMDCVRANGFGLDNAAETHKPVPSELDDTKLVGQQNPNGAGLAQLASAFRHQGASARANKSIKFDLPAMASDRPVSAEPAPDEEQARGLTNCARPDGPEDDDDDSCGFVSGRQRDHLQQRVALMVADSLHGGLVVNSDALAPGSGLFGSAGAHKYGHTGLSGCARLAADQDVARPPAHCRHQHSTGVSGSSPFVAQTTISGSRSRKTVQIADFRPLQAPGSNANPTHHRHHLAHHAHHHAHTQSIASPSLSTTLSSTPIQTATESSGNDNNQGYNHIHVMSSFGLPGDAFGANVAQQRQQFDPSNSTISLVYPTSLELGLDLGLASGSAEHHQLVPATFADQSDGATKLLMLANGNGSPIDANQQRELAQIYYLRQGQMN